MYTNVSPILQCNGPCHLFRSLRSIFVYNSLKICCILFIYSFTCITYFVVNVLVFYVLFLCSVFRSCMYCVFCFYNNQIITLTMSVYRCLCFAHLLKGLKNAVRLACLKRTSLFHMNTYLLDIQFTQC